MIRNTEK